MHVLQWVAVKADDVDEAFSSVKSYLESNLDTEYTGNSWYDWFVTGGGRWNPNEDSQYNDNDTSMVLSYETDPDLFEERVLQSMELRKEEFDSYAKDVEPSILDKVIKDFNPRERNFEFFHGLYAIKKIIDMAYGEWDYTSYFLDCQNDSTTPAYMFGAIDKGEKNWYLVPVDFHF